MQNSKQFLAQHNYLPRISFKDGQKHKVELIKDKLDKITDTNGQIKEGVKYMVVEDGEPKTFFTSSVGLIQKLSEYKENTEVYIQMKSKKGPDGFKSYFEVSKVGEKDDIPVIEEAEYEGEQGVSSEDDSF